MATQLEKDLTRETTIKVNDREILISINADQTVSMKLKGMKSGMVSIGIKELYEQLTGTKITASKTDEPKAISITHEPKRDSDSDNLKISLHDIRHAINIEGLEYSVTAKLDGILSNLIEEAKK